MKDFLVLRPLGFGLDISDLSLKIVNLQRRDRFFDLASWGEAAVPPGIIEQGEIKDEKALASLIRQAVAQVRGRRISTDWVVVSLPEEKSFLSVIQLPHMTPAELEKAVPFEAENHIPLSVKESILDFEVVEPLVNHLDHLDVLLASAPQKIIDSYLRVVQLAGLKPLALEIESLASSRALVKDGLSKEPLLLIDLGATRTGLIIFSGKSIRFTSSLSFSSGGLTRSLARALGVGLDQAEDVKQRVDLEAMAKVSLKERTGDEELEKEITPDPKISLALKQALNPLVSDVKNFLDFYYSHLGHEHLLPGRHEIKKVILTGGGANLKGLTGFLAQELKLDVSLGNPWVNILPDPEARVPEIYLRRSLSYANVLGLALRGIMLET